MLPWVGEMTQQGPWAFRLFSHTTCLSDHGHSPCYALGACRMGDRNCGTEPWAGTLVPWGMPGLAVPKPREQPHPSKPNEELWLKGPFRCALAIYNPARAGTGENQCLREGGVWGGICLCGTLSASPEAPESLLQIPLFQLW